MFEDYSFSKHLLYGITKAHMFWLLLGLYTKNRKQITTYEIVKVSLCTKEGRSGLRIR